MDSLRKSLFALYADAQTNGEKNTHTVLCAEQEWSVNKMDDLISRRAAIKAIDDLPNCYNGYSDTYDKACIIGVLEELPTIEPKHGKWIKNEDRDNWWHCSVCGENDLYAFAWNYDKGGNEVELELQDYYCPHCGARMEGN